MPDTGSAIGGYFELEIQDRGSLYHDDALAFNSGKNALEYILSCKKHKKIHIPYFTCDVILEPIKKLGIEYKYYSIDASFAPQLDEIDPNDAVLYTNYFGLNTNNIKRVSKQYRHVIIDNAQALLDKPMQDVCTFYSPRKFVGVADGGFVYGAGEIPLSTYQTDKSRERMMHLLCRIEEGAELGYSFFKENDERLSSEPIKLMSELTRRLLRGIDYSDLTRKRMENFQFFHKKLRTYNKLSDWIDQAEITCPLVYPFWVDNGNELRALLASNRIYTAMYWPNVREFAAKDSIEIEFTNNIVAIPIDQRYTTQDLSRVLKYLP